MRGVVSLAAALALPLFTASGAPFPDRDLILFVTFGIIVVTLIGQGLMLPGVVSWLGLAAHARKNASASTRTKSRRGRGRSTSRYARLKQFVDARPAFARGA